MYPFFWVSVMGWSLKKTPTHQNIAEGSKPSSASLGLIRVTCNFIVLKGRLYVPPMDFRLVVRLPSGPSNPTLAGTAP